MREPTRENDHGVGVRWNFDGRRPAPGPPRQTDQTKISTVELSRSLCEIINARYDANAPEIFIGVDVDPHIVAVAVSADKKFGGLETGFEEREACGRLTGDTAYKGFNRSEERPHIAECQAAVKPQIDALLARFTIAYNTGFEFRLPDGDVVEQCIHNVHSQDVAEHENRFFFITEGEFGIAR
jgi:hypothetical protein